MDRQPATRRDGLGRARVTAPCRKYLPCKHGYLCLSSRWGAVFWLDTVVCVCTHVHACTNICSHTPTHTQDRLDIWAQHWLGNYGRRVCRELRWMPCCEEDAML